MRKKTKTEKRKPLKKRYQQERLRIIFEYSPVAIWEENFTALARLRQILSKAKVTDIRKYLLGHPHLVKDTFRKLKIVDVNKEALKLYGAKTKRELIENLGRTVHKEAFHVLVDEFAALLEGESTFEAEFKSKTLSGKSYDVALKVSVPDVYKKSFKRVIVTLRDISVQKRYERHLKRLAQTDGLTKLFNHNAIRYRIEEEFRRAQRYHLDLSCIMIDLDHFKKINDKYGHQKGNSVLKRSAALIKKHLREVDIIGRFGGDEFLVILPETSQQNAKVAALRLQKLFSSIVEEQKKTSYVTLSIGISGRPDGRVKSAKDLIDVADQAMYDAKKAGRNRVVAAFET